MYLAPDNKNRKDPTVKEVQWMLNAIRANYHHDWEYLTPDGIYGEKSARVVKKFQEYRGISSQQTNKGPILGDTTVRYIEENFKTVPQLRAASPDLKPYKEPFFDTLKIKDVFMDLISTFDAFLNDQLNYIRSFNGNNPQAFKQNYFSIATKLDPQLNKLKNDLKKAFNSKKGIKKKHLARATADRKELVKDLKRFNIVEKIEDQLKKRGFSMKIEVKFLKGKPNIPIKGSGLLQLYVFKDVLWDLCRFTEYGTEKWKDDILKHLSDLFDALIVGLVSTFIAELIVAAGAAAAVALAGVTVSTGVIVVIVAIVATIIGIVISFIMYDHDFSFGELAIEGYTQIIESVKI